MLQRLFWIGWGGVLFSTYLVDHFASNTSDKTGAVLVRCAAKNLKGTDGAGPKAEATRPSNDVHLLTNVVYRASLFALRGVGVADARTHGPMVQTRMP